MLGRGTDMTIMGSWDIPKWVPRPLSNFLYYFSAFLSVLYISVSFPLLWFSFFFSLSILPSLPFSSFPMLSLSLSLALALASNLSDSFYLPLFLVSWSYGPSSRKLAEACRAPPVGCEFPRIIYTPKEKPGHLPWAACSPGDHRYPCAKGSWTAPGQHSAQRCSLHSWERPILGRPCHNSSAHRRSLRQLPASLPIHTTPTTYNLIPVLQVLSHSCHIAPFPSQFFCGQQYGEGGWLPPCEPD